MSRQSRLEKLEAAIHPSDPLIVSIVRWDGDGELVRVQFGDTPIVRRNDEDEATFLDRAHQEVIAASDPYAKVLVVFAHRT